MAGVIVFLGNFIPGLTPQVVTPILALALAVFGLFGLYTSLRIASQVGLQWGRLLAGIIHTLLGGMLFFATAEEALQMVQGMGVLLLIAGIALFIYSLILFRKQTTAREAETAATLGVDDG